MTRKTVVRFTCLLIDGYLFAQQVPAKPEPQDFDRRLNEQHRRMYQDISVAHHVERN
jgi:hypothetical protein